MPEIGQIRIGVVDQQCDIVGDGLDNLNIGRRI
jgi:hypothetical protein